MFHICIPKVWQMYKLFIKHKPYFFLKSEYILTYAYHLVFEREFGFVYFFREKIDWLWFHFLIICSQGISRNRQRRIRGKMEKSSQSKFTIFFFIFSVQDFLEKAKKEFEEQWSKNPKVSRKNTGNVFHKLFSTGYISEHISLVLTTIYKKVFLWKKNNQ